MNDYTYEVEIYEGKGGELRKEGDKIIYPDLAGDGICAWMYRGDGRQSYRVGQTFTYPDEAGRLCPWLLDSLLSIIQVLRLGGTLPWRYADTPYEKVIDPEGITTEFIRCIDPTASGIVVKVTRTRLPD